MPTIRIEDQVYNALARWANERQLGMISPNNALRRLLGMQPTGSKQGNEPPKKRKAKRKA